MEKIQSIDRYGKQAKGRKELKSHLEGKRLTLRQMILAKCYDCMGYFADGKVDCNIPECALYPVMVYRKGDKYRTKALSDDHKKALKKGRRSAKQNTPTFALEAHTTIAREKENAGGIPEPYPREKRFFFDSKKALFGGKPENHPQKPCFEAIFGQKIP